MSFTDYKVVENITDEGCRPLLRLKTQEEKDESEYEATEHLPLVYSEEKTKALYKQFYLKYGRDFDPYIDNREIILCCA